jgi:hypothetical protein
VSRLIDVMKDGNGEAALVWVVDCLGHILRSGGTVDVMIIIF